MSTVPSAPTGTVTMFGIARLAPSNDARSSTYRLAASGRLGTPCAKAVQKPTPDGPTTVTLSTTAVVVAAGGSAPSVTRTLIVVPAPIAPDWRVSTSRVGDASGT